MHSKRVPEPEYGSEYSSGVLQKMKSTECAGKRRTGNSGNRDVIRREERNIVTVLRKLGETNQEYGSAG